MEQIEIILEAEGIENQLEELKEEYLLKLDYDCEANFDGTLCCSIVGTAVNIGMFLLQAYALWGNKRVSVRTRDLDADEMTIENVIKYINAQKDKQ